jgi:hypothetical protein
MTREVYIVEQLPRGHRRWVPRRPWLDAQRAADDCAIRSCIAETTRSGYRYRVVTYVPRST